MFNYFIRSFTSRDTSRENFICALFGYSWSGPKAYDIDDIDPTANVTELSRGHKIPSPEARPLTQPTSRPRHKPNFVTHVQYLMSVAPLKKKLADISRIEEVLARENRKPNKEEVMNMDFFRPVKVPSIDWFRFYALFRRGIDMDIA